MAYIPHTDADRAAMLAAIGVESLDHLFDSVPQEHRFPGLNIPGKSFYSLVQSRLLQMEEIEANSAYSDFQSFFFSFSTF